MLRSILGLFGVMFLIAAGMALAPIWEPLFVVFNVIPAAILEAMGAGEHLLLFSHGFTMLGQTGVLVFWGIPAIASFSLAAWLKFRERRTGSSSRRLDH